MKPGAYDPSMDSAILLGVGSAHELSGPKGDHPSGRLYVPDPEARHGWREFYVPQSAGRITSNRRLGFAPPIDPKAGGLNSG